MQTSFEYRLYSNSATQTACHRPQLLIQIP
jgi:hypothetical protein